jgi:hypothetical protein
MDDERVLRPEEMIGSETEAAEEGRVPKQIKTQMEKVMGEITIGLVNNQRIDGIKRVKALPAVLPPRGRQGIRRRASDTQVHSDAYRPRARQSTLLQPTREGELQNVLQRSRSADMVSHSSKFGIDSEVKLGIGAKLVFETEVTRRRGYKSSRKRWSKGGYARRTFAESSGTSSESTEDPMRVGNARRLRRRAQNAEASMHQAFGLLTLIPGLEELDGPDGEELDQSPLDVYDLAKLFDSDEHCIGHTDTSMISQTEEADLEVQALDVGLKPPDKSRDFGEVDRSNTKPDYDDLENMLRSWTRVYGAT